MKITVMASGGGGNFVFLKENSDLCGFTIIKLITDRPCGAELKAAELNVKQARLRRNEMGSIDASEMLNAIPQETDLVVLAGFMPIVPTQVINAWEGKIINTHPSLLPNHGGIGMYGVRVQESVLTAGDSIAGCTVHFVTDDVDMGPIIKQTVISIPNGIGAWELGSIIYDLEGPQLLDAIKILKGR